MNNPAQLIVVVTRIWSEDVRLKWGNKRRCLDFGRNLNKPLYGNACFRLGQSGTHYPTRFMEPLSQSLHGKQKWILIEPSLLLRIEWTSDKLIHSLHALFNKKRLCHSQRRKIRKDKNCTSNIQSIEHFKNTPILYKNTSVLAYTVCDCYRCSTNHAINCLVINIQFMCIIINSNSCWGHLQGSDFFCHTGANSCF